MKKVLSIIAVSLLAITGMVTATAVTAINNNKEQEVKADYAQTKANGLYERIENVSEIVPGTKVILATKSGYVLNGVGGNPAYAHGDPGGVTQFGPYTPGDYYDDWRNEYNVQDPYKFLWLNNISAVELTVEQGSDQYSSSYFSFSSNFTICGRLYEHHYLGENDEEQLDGVDDYYGVAYFLSGFGVRKTKDGKSTWELTYDSENKRMLIRKVSKTDLTSYICYDYRGARHHFLFGGEEGAQVNLYRKVSDDNLVRPIDTVAPYCDPTKLNYRLGDKMVYDGMVVEFRINRENDNHDDYLLVYDSVTSCMFSEPTTIITGNTEQTVRVFGKIPYVITITIISNASGYTYSLRNSLSPDLRGTYLLVMDNDRILKAAQETETMSNFIDKQDTDNDGDNIIANDVDLYHVGTDIDQATIKIVRTEINGSYYYHAKNVNDKYLCLGNQVDEKDEYYIAYTDNATVNNAVTVTASSFKIGDYYINNSTKTKLISFNKYSDSTSLYKLNENTGFVDKEVSDFINYFETKTTNVCALPDEDPEFDKINDELWNEIKTEFEKLGPDAQGIFASTTYTHGTESLKTKENVVDRYDYILAKYNKGDFMLRRLVNTYTNNFSNRPLITTTNNYSTLIVAITLTTTSFIAVVGLMLFRKRKHQ